MALVLLQTTAFLSLLAPELVGSGLPEWIHPCRPGREARSATHEDRGSRIEDRKSRQFQILDLRSSIFDLRSPIHGHQSSIRSSRFLLCDHNLADYWPPFMRPGARNLFDQLNLHLEAG